MPRPYSADLRERVLRAWERGEGTPAEVARRFGVCVATVYNWLHDAREEGRRTAKPHAGGTAPLLDAAALQVLRQLVIEQNDAMLTEYAERLAERTGRRVSPPVLCRALKTLKLTRKKRRFGRLNGIVPRSRPSAIATASGSTRSAPTALSSSTRAE